jgi:hypothetical protein
MGSYHLRKWQINKNTLILINSYNSFYLTNIFMHVIIQLIKGVAAFGQAASPKSF